MSWVLGGFYCGLIWLIFAKLKLVRLSLPIAIVLASVGPSLILVLLFCAQLFHPFTSSAIVTEQVDPIVPQLSRQGRVTRIAVVANERVEAGDVLFEVDRVPYENKVRQAEASLEQSKQRVELARSTVTLSEATRDRSIADLEYAKNDRDRNQKLRESGGASQDELERALTRYQQAIAAAKQAEQQLTQSTLSVDVAAEDVRRGETSLADAAYDLQQTTVLAPAAGYITNLQLREGMMVDASSGPVMTFVRDKPIDRQGIVVATFGEKSFLRIHAGQYAETAMDAYPGEILTGRVENTIQVSGKGQLAADGILPSALVDGSPTVFAVRIKLDHPDRYPLPGGAQGQAAVYTEQIQIAGIPTMFLMRAKSWLNYLF